MSPTDIDALVRRANAAGFDNLAEYAASLENRQRRAAGAGWLAGAVLALGNAWWWGNVYVALFVFVGGIVLTLTTWKSLA